MSNIGNLEFGVHLVDHTNAEADKIKRKLENLSIKLNIDGKNIKVSNTDDIKKQIENAVKSVSISSVKLDTNTLRQQITAAIQGAAPHVKITLDKGSLNNDLQTYLDTKVFRINISILKHQLQSELTTVLSTISVPVNVKVSSNAVIQSMQQALSKRSIPVNVRVNDVNSFISDIERKMSNRNVKIGIEADLKRARTNISNQLRGQIFTAELKLLVKQADVQDAIKQAFKKAGLNYNNQFINNSIRGNRGVANSYREAANGAEQFARASVSVSNGLKTNIRLGGQLGTVLGNLASVIGLQDVFRKVVQIGGQLENQRIALSAILQDGGKATTMFSKIQSLAVKSPFGIMDLNQYVKQLSSYQVPYNELYETMKRLADISAGVGVDMGRIILAFGQVKAAGFLKGTELRQFTEANIPMVDKLAERFSNLENRIVSAAEVYDMISKKKITFEDVKSVLWDLTGEGGMFYNMQEVLSESLASKWKNLSDAVDVMFGKIADGWVGSGLKGLAETLTELTKGWEYVSTAITTATLSYLSYKAAVLLGSKQMAATNNLISSRLSDKRKEAEALRLATTYRTLTTVERNLIATRNKLTVADLKLLIREKALNKESALRMIALGKLDRQTTAYLQRVFAITDAQIRAASSAHWYHRAITQLGIGFTRIGHALKTLLFNPWTIAITGISAIAEWVTYLGKKSEESKERINSLIQAANEGYGNLQKTVKNFDGTPTSDAGFISAIQEMEASIKDYAKNWKSILSDIYQLDSEGEYIHDLEKRYELLKEKLYEVRDAYKLVAESMIGLSETANESTDGAFDESLVKNLQDYSKKLDEYNRRVNKVMIQRVAAEKAIQSAITADDEFAESAKNKSLREQIYLLKDYSKALSVFESVFYGQTAKTSGLNSSINNLNEAFNVAKKDIDDYVKYYKSALEGIGVNIDKLTDVQKMYISIDVSNFIDSIEGLNDETKKLFYERVLKKEFNIDVNLNYTESNNIERWREELIKAVGDDNLEYVIEATMKATPDYNSMIDSVRKMYKEANEIVENLKPVLLKADISLTGKNKIPFSLYGHKDYETIKAVEEYNKAIDKINAAINIASDQGFNLEEDNKNKGEKDTVAELWEKRTKEIEKAVKMYDQWKEVEGSEKAENRVRGMEELKNLFNGNYGFKLDLENPTEFYKYIQSKLDESKDEQKKLKVELGVKVSDANIKDAKDALKIFLDESKKYIDETTSKWDLYKKIFESTGNKTTAMNIAFGKDVGFTNQLEQLRSQIEQGLKGTKFNFSDVIGFTDKELADKGLSSLKYFIDAYNKESQKISEKSIENFIEIINSSKDFAQQISDIETKLVRDLNTIYGSLLPVEEKSRLEKQLYENYEENIAKINFEKFKKTSGWVSIFDDLSKVSTGTLDGLLEDIEKFIPDGVKSEKVFKELIKSIRKVKEELLNRNPFRAFSNDTIISLGKINHAISEYNKKIKEAKQNGDTGKVKELEAKKYEEQSKRREIYSDYSSAFKAGMDKVTEFSNSVSEASSILERFGNESLKNFASFLDSISKGMQSGYNVGGMFGGVGSVIGGFVGAATGAMAGIVEAGRNAVQAEQDRSQIVIDRLEKVASILKDKIAGSLTGLYNSALSYTAKVEMELQKQRYDAAEKYYKDKGETVKENEIKATTFDNSSFSWNLDNYIIYSKKTHDAINKAIESDNEYMAAYASMLAQRDELIYQQATYSDKDSDDVEAFKRDKALEIEKLTMEIEQLSKDMLSSLYSIDFKDWAGQFTDAIVGAWSKGEDAAKAYQDVVSDVMKNVATSMIQQLVVGRYLEEQLPAFVEKFIANNGLFDDELLAELGGVIDGLTGRIEIAENLLDGWEDKLNEKGISLKETEGKEDSLSKGIQSVTEDTANLLASYLNALRQDVSVKRSLIEKLIGEDMPKMSVIAQAQLTQLNIIASNTLRNADTADRIYELVNRVVDRGSNKLKI